MLQVHSRSSSAYNWSTRSELYPETDTAQPGQPGTTRMHTHRKSTHTLGNGDTTASQRGAGRCCCRAAGIAAAAAAAAATTVLLLLHDPRCIAERNPSQQTVARFMFCGTHAGARNGTAAPPAAAAAAAAGPATGEAKTYIRVYY